MNNFLAQPSGATNKGPNKSAIARIFGIKDSDVTYLDKRLPIDGYKVLFDPNTQMCFWNTNGTGTPTSWSVTGDTLTLVTSTGSFTSKVANKSSARTVNSFTELRTITPDYEGQEIILLSYNSGKSLGGGRFIGYLTNGVDDGGTIATSNSTAGYCWKRINFDHVVPEMFGIESQDTSTPYTVWNVIFSSGYPIVIPKGDYYVVGGEITITDLDVSVSGFGRGISNLIFTTANHGIHQITSSGTNRFNINSLSILTSVDSSKNQGNSAFFYDAQTYLDTLTIQSNGYKYISNRSLDRGNIYNLDVGGSTFKEDTIGWGTCLEFLGCLNYTVSDIIARCPNNLSSDAFWIHGDGMIVDYRFTNIHVFWAYRAFRINDYSEGFHLSEFELTNVKYGILCLGDADTQTKGNLIYNSWYINNGHIMSYATAIAVRWQVSGKYSNLEIFVQPNGSDFIYKGIEITTCDSVLIDNCAFTLLNGDYKSTFGIDLGSGWGNKISAITLKGINTWTNGISLGSMGSFTGSHVSGVDIYNSVNTMSLNWDNCVNNRIEPPNVISSTTQSFPLADKVINNNSIDFKVNIFNTSYSYNGTSTQFSVDISGLNFQQVPLLAEVSEITTLYGNVTYSYRRDASTNKTAVIEATAINSSEVTAVNRPVFIKFTGI